MNFALNHAFGRRSITPTTALWKNRGLEKTNRLEQWASLIVVLSFILLWPTGRALAQTAEVQYGFVRDDTDSTRIIAVAIPGDDLTGLFLLNQGALFTFYLPSGTIVETTPNDVQSDLVFTAHNGTVWHVEVFTDAWMDSLSLDTTDRDVYRFSVVNTVSVPSTTDPIHLFSFTLPDGCDGGTVNALVNGDSFSSSLLVNYAVSIDHFFPAVIAPNIEAANIYVGNDAVSSSLACEHVPLSVTLAYFHAQMDGGVVAFEWQTVTEMGNAGFNLLAADDDDLIPLNAELVPSKAIDSLIPTDYRFSTTTASENFYLDEVGIDGATVRNGPYALNRSYGIPSEINATDVEPALYLPMISR